MYGDFSGVDEELSDDVATLVFAAFLGFPAVEVEAVRLVDANESVPCFNFVPPEDLVGAMAISTRPVIVRSLQGCRRIQTNVLPFLGITTLDRPVALTCVLQDRQLPCPNYFSLLHLFNNNARYLYTARQLG